MCGIAGVVGARADREPIVRAMTTAIRHRGPDDEGFWHDDGCSLGHRRLSIIDLSPAGRQPMPNEDGSVQVVFNGEIYGFDASRRRLEAAGHAFRSRTDTEVIVHLYEEHGEDFVRHLNGMFAIALWDARRQKLVLARDRFGQKPLFWARVPGGLAFASEIKALLQHPDIPRDVDPEAVDRFLTLHFVPAPWTLYRAIRRLPAASLLVREPGREPAIRRYWDLDGIAPQRIAFEDAVAEVDRHLTRAVREQLVSDVPVGLFLSGGIDSTLILSKASELQPGIQSFSIGFRERAYSELDHARAVAERFGSPHHAIVLSVDDARHPEKLLQLFDEPFADIAAIPQVHLSRTARPSVTVALTGDGGDELFGGYEHHVLGYWLSRARLVAGLRAAAAGAAFQAIPRTGARGPLRRFRRGLETLSHADWQDAVLRLRSTLQVEDRVRLYTPEYLASLLGAEPWESLLADPTAPGVPPVERLFRPAGDRVLADQFLMKTDLASMSVGLECRSPFLDTPLAELVASFPAELKVSGLKGKRILRRLLETRVSRAIWARRKTGLTMPVEEWIRRDLAGLITDTLLAPSARVAAYVRRDVVGCLFDEHRRGVANHRRILWGLLLLELWLARR